MSCLPQQEGIGSARTVAVIPRAACDLPATTRLGGRLQQGYSATIRVAFARRARIRPGFQNADDLPARPVASSAMEPSALEDGKLTPRR